VTFWAAYIWGAAKLAWGALRLRYALARTRNTPLAGRTALAAYRRGLTAAAFLGIRAANSRIGYIRSNYTVITLGGSIDTKLSAVLFMGYAAPLNADFVKRTGIAAGTAVEHVDL
jgi:hypothetical protein